MFDKVSRRAVLGGIAAASFADLAPIAQAAELPKLPSSPVTLNIVDVAGNLALTRPAFDAYLKQKPNLVSHITFNTAPAPELPGKLAAEQSAGRLDIDMVLTGVDALSAGIEQHLWLHLFPEYASALPNLTAIYQPMALEMQKFAADQGVAVVFCPAGPLIEYDPAKVPTPPTTPAELLAWAQAHPKQFIYARPANSGPARIFLMGLPYLLGDADPSDPRKGWDKTWAFLAALGKTIEYYPSGTGAVMKELGSGLRAMTTTQTGWDINPRALGVVPKSVEVVQYKNQQIVCDAQYMCVPKGVSPEKLAVLLDLMSFMLQPPQQAITYDQGYFYPGPAVRGVPISLAPALSQQAIQEYGRTWYDHMIETVPLHLPLTAPDLVYALGYWDKNIGNITAN
jgi:putative spermidine/putrescine transport system substrate-binding protein